MRGTAIDERKLRKNCQRVTMTTTFIQLCRFVPTPAQDQTIQAGGMHRTSGKANAANESEERAFYLEKMKFGGVTTNPLAQVHRKSRDQEKRQRCRLKVGKLFGTFFGGADLQHFFIVLVKIRSVTGASALGQERSFHLKFAKIIRSNTIDDDKEEERKEDDDGDDDKRDNLHVCAMCGWWWWMKCL